MANEQFSVSLSTRPDHFMGDISTWDAAEAALRESLDRFVGNDAAPGGGLMTRSWSIKEGDGAFYGPKVDVEVRDAMGRAHQVGITIISVCSLM